MSEEKTYKCESIYEALCYIQENIKQPSKSQQANVTTKNGGSYSYSYASLEDVQKSIKAAAKDTGLFYVQMPVKRGNSEIGVRTILYHADGESIDCGEFVMTRDGSARMSMAQAEGSVLTFCRRYTLSSIFGITSDNEDGNVDGDVTVVEHEAMLLIDEYMNEVSIIANISKEEVRKSVLKHIDEKGFNDIKASQRQKAIGFLKAMKIKAKQKRDKEALEQLNQTESDVNV